MTEHYDVIIIGSGAGGGTIAYALAGTGKKILLVERGGYLPREKQNWDPDEVFLKNRYTTDELWLDKQGKRFRPGTHYFVGGNTKFYGAALLRLRERDFDEVKHYGGISPAWPLKYREFQPWYMKAENLYQVHGKRGEDPLEPPEPTPYPFPAVSHESRIKEIYDDLHKAGVKAFHLPEGIRLNEQDRPHSLCIRCDTCDGFPCLVNAKSDAHMMCVEPALKHPNCHLLTDAKAMRLHTDITGRTIQSVEIERHGQKELFTADHFVVSCGAINTAALLLRSANDKHPNGLANSSGMMGRHYMCHNNTALIAISNRRNPTLFQKTIGINDFYYESPEWAFPMGHIQLLGKVKRSMLQGDAPFFTPNFILEYMAEHAIGWWMTTEDLPDPNNRVELAPDGSICLHYTPNNREAHKRLLNKLKQILKSIGHAQFFFPNSIYLAKQIPIAGVAHQVGTCRFGTDPKSSVLDTDCKAHDHDNLYVVDGSFFPSSSSVNPGLTIMANALRVGEILSKRL